MSDKTNTKDSRKAKVEADAFEKRPQDDGESGAGDEVSGKLPADFDELPIELVSLTDR
jgi:hypothetical protein